MANMDVGGGGIGVRSAIHALVNMVQSINKIASIMQTIFPLATSTTSTTATGGAQTLPANPAGFLNVTLNGTPVKVPYYNP